MLLLFRLLGFVCFTLTLGTYALSNTLRLTAGQKWLVAESLSSLTAAKLATSKFNNHQDPIAIVRSQNGWYAIVFGPLKATDLETAKKQISSNLPDDVFITDGRGFSQLLWQPQPIVRLELDDMKIHLGSLSTHKGDYQISALRSCQKAGCTLDDFNPIFFRVTLNKSGKTLFDKKIPVEYPSKYGQLVELVWLDNSSPHPQIITKSYSGGAHCCSLHTVHTYQNNKWHTIDAGALDGFEGYSYVDLDGDHELEIVSRDNSFLYQYASYAGSYAPLKLEKLKGIELIDQKYNPALKEAYKTGLKQLEEYMQEKPDLWQEPGYLAAWVAYKSILGTGAKALKTASEKYVAIDGFGVHVCDSFASKDQCPDEKGVTLPFAAGLMLHLSQQGYIQLPH